MTQSGFKTGKQHNDKAFEDIKLEVGQGFRLKRSA